MALVILLLFSTLAWAGANSNPDDYAINIHVTSSRMVGANTQRLKVVIDGKKYVLEASGKYGFVLALGDYKAKLVRDDHRSAYDSRQIYEFRFPDNKTRQFWVVGQTE
jgi:hypothetical protein